MVGLSWRYGARQAVIEASYNLVLWEETEA